MSMNKIQKTLSSLYLKIVYNLLIEIPFSCLFENKTFVSTNQLKSSTSLKMQKLL